jgi:hypothetical protein
MRSELKNESTPIRVWRPEGWKPRRNNPQAPVWMRVVAFVFQVFSIPFRPIGWVVNRLYLAKFRREVFREFEGAFPGKTVILVRSLAPYGWPSATVDIGEMRISVSTHMGDFNASVEVPRDAVSSSATRDYVALETECSRHTFGSVREVAAWFADWFRNHAVGV